MKFAALTNSAFFSSLESEFNFKGSPDATRLTVIAELIRGAIETASLVGNKEHGSAVSPQKLAFEMRRKVASLWAGLEGDMVSTIVADEVLALLQVGDIWKTEGGHYAISPPRLIRIDDTYSLLVGGGTAQMMPRDLQKRIIQAGRARLWLSHRDAHLYQLSSQSLQSWLSLPAGNAKDWADRFLASLTLSTPLDDEAEDLLVLHRTKWLPVSGLKGASGLRLARRAESIFGSRSFRYYVCHLTSQGFASSCIDQLAGIARSDARRLQPSMCSDEFDKPTLQYERQGDFVDITISWPLPDPQTRILHLGWRLPVADTQNDWPQRYRFCSKLFPMLVLGFEILGYTVVQK